MYRAVLKRSWLDPDGSPNLKVFIVQRDQDLAGLSFRLMQPFPGDDDGLSKYIQKCTGLDCIALVSVLAGAARDLGLTVEVDHDSPTHILLKGLPHFAEDMKRAVFLAEELLHLCWLRWHRQPKSDWPEPEHAFSRSS